MVEFSTGWIALGLVIGLTVLVQAAANKFMQYVEHFIKRRDFFMKETVSILLLIWIVILAILVDVIVWSVVLLILGIFDDAFTFATDSFTTLGGNNNIIIESPYQYIGPVISANGIVLIAFAGSYFYDLLYKV